MLAPFLLAALACTGGEELSPEDIALEPLEEVTLDPPTDDDDPTPERAVTESGADEDWDWAHLRGWVKADGADVFAALTDPDVGVDRREMAEWSSAEVEDDEVDVAYVVNNVVTDPVTVDFDVTWRHAWAEDEDNGTGGSVTVWAKTGGTEFIPLLEGSAVTVDEGSAVDVVLVYHLDTFDSSPEDAVRYLEDFYASIVAVAHGDPLPTYE